MKFSHQLQLNAVPDWIDKYVAYDALKKIIFQLEKERVDDPVLTEERRLDAEARFLTALDMQLEKVFDFYTQQESELFLRIDELEGAVSSDHKGHRLSLNASHPYKSAHSPLENLESELHDASEKTIPDTKPEMEHSKVHFRRRSSTTRISIESRLTRHTTRDSQVYVEQLVDLRSQLIDLFVSLSELESYIELNRTAFQKILKKYDKLLDGNLREQYLPKMVLDSHPFTPRTVEILREQIERVERLYADALCYGNHQMAVRQMKSHLRDQVTFDRNTVWKDMVGQERRINDAHVKDKAVPTVKIPFTKYRINKELFRQIICFSIAIAALIILLNVDCFGNRQENYCFALLIFAAIMWATEAIPIYATSLMIPFLIVPLGILRNPDGSEMPAKAASKAVFQSMFSGTIMMLLGGFALAAALSKYGIAKAFASHVLSRAGTRPRWVLLAIMLVAVFLSMWISNVATPVLCFSLIDPILRTLADDSPVAQCLLLGIALASCIGGMTSPISSPQNIVTIQYMQPNPGWGKWFGVALPISIISVFVAWAILLLVYRPDRASPHLNTIKPTKGKANWTQMYVMFITILTIGLWCAESSMEAHIGDTGIIAAIPLFMFFGTGILNKDDLNNFLWSVVVLAQGGMALGNAVTSSGLLQDIALQIKDGIQNLEVIAILAIFSFLILVFATFVSHTVAALIIVPIVREVGQNLPVPHPNLLVMGAGLACSAGMGLPVSGYPNMSAVMMENPLGKPYLTTKDFIITGIPTSIICTVLVFTLGYGIMAGFGF
ncbi:SPX-domain-containing protein [Basidiobolus meristosporus CBS 931.73]|uniref:SPX-domain-containing protein n=1 Tax=Basidiobolus meristosporus CBS 931.73 TaxID=1314790 RepID=A0A1Y1Y4Z8_9FUNG|nr:SPX-domain-containing protein [Basidiobolus meristosporus CBS 931.73]|eukprot:ORX93102.1 SPX-domain-containing protein [Basidiobolus meristosporus CBS 931.73]